ncbi:MAG TPA: hypothetical protein VJ945_07845 [Flavobacteriaceae bacterium]|nr:hypothetical protein [Flavobacteriaceae bacterium]
MRKIFKLVTLLSLAISMTGCATVFGGPITQSQRRKPKPGEQTRKIRVVAFIADAIIFAPSLILDFADCAIYRPQ